jgi:hypothetical protein
MSAENTTHVKVDVSPQDGPLSTLDPEIHESWNAYLKGFSETLPKDDALAVYAKLYAAMGRLNEAVRERTVCEAIMEIGSNLMACEQMAVLVPQGQSKSDAILQCVGVERKQLKKVSEQAERIMEGIPEGEIYVKSLSKLPNHALTSLGINACAPVSQKGLRKGAILFFEFLPHRVSLNVGDHALVKLLSIYAGPCLFDF